jgi:hypothetical protein
MKKYIMMGAIAALAVGSLTADDSLKGKTTKSVSKKTTKVAVSGPVDRQLELRVGPRLSFLTGEVRMGQTGTVFDVWDDFGFEDVNAGVQFNADWQPRDRWHVELGATWDNYDQTGTTARNITDGDEVLLAGAATRADIDAFTLEGTIGYDVIKNNTWRIKPYIGGKGIYGDGILRYSGVVQNSAGGVVDAARTSTTNLEEGYGFAFGGLDTRAYVSRNWYVGGDIGASGWENWYVLTGDAYTGYDFNQTWGVRAGYAYDYFNRENDNRTSKQDLLLGAAYVQVVWGF